MKKYSKLAFLKHFVTYLIFSGLFFTFLPFKKSFADEPKQPFANKPLAKDNLFKERLKKAKKGDFIVFEYNKLYSALSVFDIDDNNHKITLEEITLPKDGFDKNISFKDFLEKPKNVSSWMLYEIDLNENKIIDAYSISRNCFIDLKNFDSIITKLLKINLNKLNNFERKKIGPSPMQGEMDRRALWQPMKFENGKRIKRAKFDTFRSIWPEDGSELSSKTFDIYFDENFAFPYFIEINNGHMSYMIKAVDSGKDLQSTTNFFPKRKAEITNMKRLDDTLFIEINNASHFENFNLFAIDITSDNKMIHPLKFEMGKKGKLVFLKIDLKNFNEIFLKNHKYRIVLTPYFHKDVYIESKNLFVYK